MGTPSATAAPGPNPRPTGDARDPGRRDSASPRPAGTARPADTALGSCELPETGRTCWSRSTLSPQATATTGSKAGAIIPGSSCGTCPRCGTPPEPAPSVAGPPPRPTSSTTPRTRRADGPACVTAALSVGMTIGASSTPGGRSTSCPTVPTAGPPPPGGPTPPNPRGTRCSRRGDGPAEDNGVTLCLHHAGGEAPRWQGLGMG